MTDPHEGSTRATQLATALARVRQRIGDAASAAGRDPAEVELLPVTKFFPASDVEVLYQLGCRAFGESRDQEAVAKVAAVNCDDIRWHMVGRVQRNKANSVARWAYSVHSADSTRVVQALAAGCVRAADAGHRSVPLWVYLQISLDGDLGRGGIDIADRAQLDGLCALVSNSDQLNLAGLMALPPRGVDPERAFARLQQEHRRVSESYPHAGLLSAGMSTDLEIAVKYGSTCVRVGTALMGTRPLTSP